MARSYIAVNTAQPIDNYCRPHRQVTLVENSEKADLAT
jgi:hypothetical protein